MAAAHDAAHTCSTPTTWSTSTRAPSTTCGHARRVPRARDRGLLRAPPHPGAHRHPRSRDRSAARAATRWRTSSARCRRSSPTPAHAGTRRRAGCPLQMAPEQDSEWAPELEEFDGLLANLPDAHRRRAADAIAGLRSLEREVSDERRALFGGDRPHRPRRSPRSSAELAGAETALLAAPVGSSPLCNGWPC